MNSNSEHSENQKNTGNNIFPEDAGQRGKTFLNSFSHLKEGFFSFRKGASESQRAVRITLAVVLLALLSSVLSSVSLDIFINIRQDKANLTELYGSFCLQNMTGFLRENIIILMCVLFLLYLMFFGIVRKRHLSCRIVSLLLSANMLISLSMEHSELSEIFLPFGYIGNVVVFLGFSFLISGGIELFYLLMERLSATPISPLSVKSITSEKVFFCSLGAIWLCWVPWMIILYPGCSFYDTYYQINEWLGLSGLDASFPVLISAVYGILYQIGVWVKDCNRGLFLIAVFQMLLNSFTVAYLSSELFRLLKRKCFSVIFVLFFAILPTWQHAATYVVKDVLHVGIFMLFYFHYLEFLLPERKPTWKRLCILLLDCLLVSFTRKAAFYIVLISVIVLTLINFRKYFFRFLAITSATVAVFYFTNLVIFPSLHISPERITENYSAQFQQVGLYCKTYADQMTEEEKAAVNNFLDFDVVVKNYTPMIVDPVKRTCTDRYSVEDHTVFWNFYDKIVHDHPLLMVKGLLMSTFEHINPWYGDVPFFMGASYEMVDNFGVINSPYLDQVESYWKSWLNIPFLRILIGTGFYAWIIVALFAYAISKKLWKAVIGSVPAMVLLIGLFLSHVNGEPRYGYPLVAVAPLVFCWAVYCAKTAKQKRSVRQSGHDFVLGASNMGQQIAVKIPNEGKKNLFDLRKFSSFENLIHDDLFSQKFVIVGIKIRIYQLLVFWNKKKCEKAANFIEMLKTAKLLQEKLDFYMTLNRDLESASPSYLSTIYKSGVTLEKEVQSYRTKYPNMETSSILEFEAFFANIIKKCGHA